VEQGLQLRPNILEYLRLGSGGRVDVVGLHPLAALGNSLQQVGNERHAVALGNVRERCLEFADVAWTIVWGHPHAGQQDTGAAAFRGLDDSRQVGFQLGSRQTPQAVVAAERDDDDGRPRALQRLADTRRPATGRFARNAGVHDAIIEPFLLQTLF
jgi:hypothetical protein